MCGTYQLKNVLGVINTIEHVIDAGFIIENNDVIKALSKVVKLTKFSGRWQVYSKTPLVITDTGHNEDGIIEVLENLNHYSFKTLHMIFGVVNDKSIDKILQLLPKKAHYYFVKASVPRALDSAELRQKAMEFQLKGAHYKDVESGLKAAKKAYKKGDLIFVGGSTFVVADLLSSK